MGAVGMGGSDLTPVSSADGVDIVGKFRQEFGLMPPRKNIYTTPNDNFLAFNEERRAILPSKKSLIKKTLTIFAYVDFPTSL